MMLIPNTLDDRAQDRVLLGARRPPPRVAFFRFAFEVRGRGDRQHAADRLDPELLPMIVNERDHHFARRSSSAWAKYADAFLRISFARRSSTFSLSSCFRRARSSVVRPGRCPLSRSAWRTHRRNTSTGQPIFSATDRIAPHCEGYSGACSKTIRTARSRNSGEYLLRRPMGPILPLNGPSDKAGTVHNDACRMPWATRTISPCFVAPPGSHSARSAHRPAAISTRHGRSQNRRDLGTRVGARLAEPSPSA